MIEKLVLESFKCFGELSLVFGPLTLLAGGNSCGKSSVMQALRILGSGEIPPGLGDARALRNESASGEARIDAFFSDGKNASCHISDAGVEIRGDIRELCGLRYISAERYGPRVNLPFIKHADHVGEHGERVYAFLQEYRDRGGVPEELRHPTKAEISGVFEQTRAWLGLVAPGEVLDFQAYEDADVAAGSFSHFRPTNVGFGLSYTLPIIASALAAASSLDASREAPILLIENPEAHLHPAGQTQIGLFLALAAKCGIQCVVETHSEHVLNGIRIAAREGKIAPDQAVFHFFTKDLKSGESEAIAIFTDEHGMLDKWPDGFFDESERSLSRLF